MPQRGRRHPTLREPFVPCWSALRREGNRTIEAYVETTRAWASIAEIHGESPALCRQTANYMMDALEHYQRSHVLMPHIVGALELCLECDRLTWAAEHDGEIAIRYARSLLR